MTPRAALACGFLSLCLHAAAQEGGVKDLPSKEKLPSAEEAKAAGGKKADAGGKDAALRAKKLEALKREQARKAAQKAGKASAPAGAEKKKANPPKEGGLKPPPDLSEVPGAVYGASAPGEAPAREEPSDRLEDDGAGALSSALGGVRSFTRTLLSPDELPPDGRGGGEAPRAMTATLEQRPGADSSDPAHPVTQRDLAAAAHTGYSPVFERLGLRAGTGPGGAPRIVERDGRPAGPARVEDLKAAILREPEALVKRPDFFQVLPRPRFEALRRRYAGGFHSDDAAFKDIGMTPGGRDFAWTASCQTVSGDCNPLTAEERYEKGTAVSPETLAGVADAVEAEEDDGWDSDGWDDYDDADAARADAEDAALDRMATRSILGEAEGLLEGLSGLFGRALGAFDGGRASEAVGGGVPAAAAGGASDPRGSAPAAPAPTAKDASGSPSAPASGPRNGARRPERRAPRALPYAFFVPVAALFLYAGLRRRRRR